MSTWSKPIQRTIDQRGEVLPPTWCPRTSDAVEAPIATNGVMRPDRTRCLVQALVRAIDGTQEMVVAATFLLADEDVEQALLRAAQRGVRVYLLLATETRLEKEPRDDSEFEQRALAEHKRMLETLAGWALIRSAPSFHAKVVLVDPARGGGAFMLTANVTHEALCRNEEIAVELTPSESQVVFEHLRWAMWEASEHELLEPGRLAAAPPALKRIAKPSARGGIVATSNEPGSLRATALEIVRAAERAIIVASYGWDAEHELIKALCARAKEGVAVTVLARVRPAAMPALLALAESGAQVVGYRYLHAKAIAIDEGTALVMSANLERHGLDDGFELGVVLEGARAAGLRDILRGWTARAPFELRRATTLGQVVGEAQVWVNGKLVPYTVASSAPIALGSVVPRSADELHAERPPVARRFGLPQPAHELDASWVVDAPRLAPKSKIVERKAGKGARPDDPPLFREANGRIVVAVRSTDEVARAREIAKQVRAAAIVVREGPT